MTQHVIDRLNQLSTKLRQRPLSVGRIEEGVISLNSETPATDELQLSVAVQPENWNTFEFWEDMNIDDLMHEKHLKVDLVEPGKRTPWIRAGNAVHWDSE